MEILIFIVASFQIKKKGDEMKQKPVCNKNTIHLVNKMTNIK